MTVADEYDLDRFVTAQDQDGTYPRVIDELRAGRKRTHWMWFVFPQIAGLGRSATSQHFAIGSLGEARAYLEHPILGPRLVSCLQILADAPEANAVQIFGEIDAQKLRSSLTLFAQAAPDQPLFGELLELYFDGVADPATDERL